MPRTSCGEVSERSAAVVHGLVAVIEAAIFVYHFISIFTHWRRGRAQRILGTSSG